MMEPDDNDTITITLGDTIYTSDNDFVLTGADDTFTTTGWNIDKSGIDDILTGGWYTDYENPSITIGKHEITEKTVEKLQALLDVIDSLEDDNDLKALFNTQLSLNRIRGEDENKSN